MGIRLLCSNGHRLHVKAFLAGKRGICPECGVKVDIPANLGKADKAARMVQSVNASAMATNSAQAGPPSSGADPAPPDLNWYVRFPDGDQFGPTSPAVLNDWVEQGRVTADCLVWAEGWPEWRPAGEILDLPDPSVGSALPPQAPDTQRSGTEDAASTVGRAPEIRTDAVASHKNSKRATRRMVYILLGVCLVLLVSMLYVLNQN